MDEVKAYSTEQRRIRQGWDAESLENFQPVYAKIWKPIKGVQTAGACPGTRSLAAKLDFDVPPSFQQQELQNAVQSIVATAAPRGKARRM